MNPNILFVSHKKTRCGVYEFGKDVFGALCHSQKYNFVYAECGSYDEFKKTYDDYLPAAVIYNYSPATMPWIIDGRIIKRIGIYKYLISDIPVPQIGIIHEVTQEVADGATPNLRLRYGTYGLDILNSLFDYYIAPDPTVLLANSFVFKTGRIIPEYTNAFSVSDKVVVGSAGFGSANKGFEKIVQLVQEEFDEAEIRLNIAHAEFGDADGVNARKFADECRRLIYKSGIELKITHEFWDKKGLLDFLAKNTVNVFLYSDKKNRGISSIIDNRVNLFNIHSSFY